jgi:hypothetical protein
MREANEAHPPVALRWATLNVAGVYGPFRVVRMPSHYRHIVTLCREVAGEGGRVRRYACGLGRIVEAEDEDSQLLTLQVHRLHRSFG